MIYPPVECSRFSISNTRKKEYYLLVSAETPYKRIDLAIEAFRILKRPLLIVGKMCSEDLRRYRLLKEKNISCLGWVSQDELARLYMDCKALVFPGEEDFGLVPVEAQAAGRPVIAYGRGGVLESVKGVMARQVKGMDRREWKTGYSGIFFDAQTPACLVDAVEVFESVEDQFEPERIKQWSNRFDRSVFEKRFLNFVDQTLKGKAC